MSSLKEKILSNNKIKFTFILIIAIIVTFSIYLVAYFLESDKGAKNIQVTNLTSNSVTISWETTERTKGSVAFRKNQTWPVLFGELVNQNDVWYDDRNVVINNETKQSEYSEEIAKDRTIHHVTIKNLEPDTEYFFRINGKLKTFEKDIDRFKTLATSDSLREPAPVYGKVQSLNGELSTVDGVVYYYIEDQNFTPNIAINSAIIQENETWSGDLTLINTSSSVKDKSLVINAVTEAGNGLEKISLEEYDTEAGYFLKPTVVNQVTKVLNNEDISVDDGCYDHALQSCLDGAEDQGDAEAQRIWKEGCPKGAEEYCRNNGSGGGNQGGGNNEWQPKTEGAACDRSEGSLACDGDQGPLGCNYCDGRTNAEGQFRCTFNPNREDGIAGYLSACGGKKGSSGGGNNQGGGGSQGGGTNNQEQEERKRLEDLQKQLQELQARCQNGDTLACNAVNGATQAVEEIRQRIENIRVALTQRRCDSTNILQLTETLNYSEQNCNSTSTRSVTCVDGNNTKRLCAPPDAPELNSCGSLGEGYVSTESTSRCKSGTTVSCADSAGNTQAYCQSDNSTLNSCSSYIERGYSRADCSSGGEIIDRQECLEGIGTVATFCKKSDTTSLPRCGTLASSNQIITSSCVKVQGVSIPENHILCGEIEDGRNLTYSCERREGTGNNIINTIKNLLNLKVQAQTEPPTPETLDPKLLSEGVYTIEVPGYENVEVTIYTNNVRLRYFNDKNGDGKRQQGEEWLQADSAAIKVSRKQSLARYNINKGWNLIGLNLISDNLDSAKELALDLHKQGIEAVQISKYDSGKWIHYVNKLNDVNEIQEYGNNFTLVPGEGYFVRSLTAGRVSLKGNKFQSSVPILLNNGWNLVSVQTPTEHRARSFLRKCREEGANCSSISRFINNVYETVVLEEDNKLFGNNFDLKKLEGYFVLNHSENKLINP